MPLDSGFFREEGAVLGVTNDSSPWAFVRRLALIAILCSVAAAVSAGTFKISDIRIEGLQRIAAGTVFNLLPVKIGEL